MVLAPRDGTPLPVDGGARPDEPTDDDVVELYDPPHDRRAFSPADMIRLGVGVGLVLVGIFVSVVAQETVKGVEEDLVEAFNRLPDALESFVLSLAQLVTSFVPAVAMVVLVLRRRWRVALLLVLAGGLANVLMVVADALVIDRRLADALDQVRDQRDLLGGAAYPARPCSPRPPRSSPWPRPGCRDDGGGPCGGESPSSPCCGSSPWPSRRST